MLKDWKKIFHNFLTCCNTIKLMQLKQKYLHFVMIHNKEFHLTMKLSSMYWFGFHTTNYFIRLLTRNNAKISGKIHLKLEKNELVNLILSKIKFLLVSVIINKLSLLQLFIILRYRTKTCTKIKHFIASFKATISFYLKLMRC